MKKIILSVFLASTLTISAGANEDLQQASISTGGVAVTALILGANFNIFISGSLITGASALDARDMKQIQTQVKADIQDYNLTGNFSLLLENIIKSTKDSNPDLSIEDIISNLENNLN